MHVHLIAPSNEDSAFVKPLWAAILAAHTPRDVEVSFHDAAFEPVDTDQPRVVPDLVGISVTSKTAASAYRLADAYRARGAQVVLGGVHVSALPGEAAVHCDAVVVGEAEGLWPTVVDDARLRRIRPVYRHERLPSLEGIPFPRRDLFRSKRYVPFDVVQTARGCPFDCEFCSVSAHNGREYRFRPVREVVEELEQVGPRVMFADDNVLVHTEHGRRLLETMPSLRKEWVGQSSLASLGRPRDVSLLARSGCKALFIGFESVSAESTRAIGKRQNDPRRYGEIVRNLADNGIAVWGSFVLGLDADDVSSFDRTVDFCIEAKLTMALFAMLTPYPGTRLYGRLEAEGRLVDPRWWLRDDGERTAPFFEPSQMTREQLRAGWVGAWRRMYSLHSIGKRYDPGRDRTWVQNLAYWPLNLTMREIAIRKIAGGRRAWRRVRRVGLPFGF